MTDDTSNEIVYSVGWSLHIEPDPLGGFEWTVQPDHFMWVPWPVTGHAATHDEADAVGRTMVQRCVEAARVYMTKSGVRNVMFVLMNMFPKTPAGGGSAVGRLSLAGALDDVGPDRWGDLEARAVDWQTRGGRQTFLSIDSADEESGWRMRELFGCMGALGEQVMLACAAARDLAAAVAAPESSRAELVRRAWAEHVIHWTMAAGHMLHNVAGRAVALDPAVRPHLLESRGAVTDGARSKALGTVFPRESDAKKDWPTFNRFHARCLMRAAAEPDATEVVELGALGHRIAVDPRWIAMSSLRDESFHRWRAQTAGVSTMTRRMTRVVGTTASSREGSCPMSVGPRAQRKRSSSPRARFSFSEKHSASSTACCPR